MNRTFKVVFNKARGALMVANEVTSSVQKKGTKQVVAAAVAMALSGAVAAATTWDGDIQESQTWANGDKIGQVTIQKGGNVSLEGTVTGAWSDFVTEEDKYGYSDAGSKLTINDGGTLTVTGNIDVGGLYINGGEVTVNGSSYTSQAGLEKHNQAIGGYGAFEMNGGTVNLNNARIWIANQASDPNANGYNPMKFSGGTINMVNGGLTGMSGTKGEGDTEHVVGNTIVLEGTVINVNKAEEGSNDKNVINSVSIEMTDGAINVAADTTLQISTYNKEGLEWIGKYNEGPDGNFTMTGGNVTNEGTIDLAVNEWKIEGGEVVNNGLIQNDSYTKDEGGQFVADSGITIANGGKLTTSIWQSHFKIKDVTVGEGGTFNIKELNSGGNAGDLENDPHTRLLIAYGNNWTLAGGDLQVAGETYTGDLKIGTADNAIDPNTNTTKGLGTLTVTDGNYDFNKVEFGSAQGNALNVQGGFVSVKELDLTHGVVNVATEGDTGVAVFGAEKVSAISGSIVAGQNAVIALGVSATEGASAVTDILKSNSLTWGMDVSSAVYVGSAIKLEETGSIVVGVNEAMPLAGNTAGLMVANGGLLAANQAAVAAGESLIDGTVSFGEGSSLAIVNATEGEFSLANNVTGTVTSVVTDNPFYAAEFENGKVVSSQDTSNGVGSIASAGIQAMTRRADFMLSQTVADRASVDQEMQPGVNLWVDVAGENYQMDGMDYGAEFEADTFYGSFGGDIKLGDAYTVGAAFQYGDGSLRSSVNGVKNDVTNYGLALYGTAKFGDAKVVGELSYIWGENDITAAQSAMNQSVDTAVYSAGVTGMYELRAGGFSFVPSIGLRISQLETDAMHVGDVAIADQDQTLVQIPVALRINGADMTAGGWKLAPSFKIAYVPTFGDTEIDVRNIETDVIDTSPVQMDFGLRAGTDNLLINAAFSLGAGKEGSSSIGGKVGLKYAF